MYYLSRRLGEGNVNPAHPTLLIELVVKSIRERRSVLLLQGVEDILAANAFGKTLAFINELVKEVSRYGGRLILSVDPRAFDAREMALLESGFDEVLGDDSFR